MILEKHSANEWNQVRPIWESLYLRLPQCTVFSSPEWVGAWLSTVGRNTHAWFLIALQGSEPVAIALLARSRIKRGPFLVTTLWFGTAGEPEADSVFVEFGDVLCLAGHELSFAQLLREHLRSQSWEEFVFPRMNPSPALDAMAEVFRDLHFSTEHLPSRFVELEEYRNPVTPFEETLPRKLRQQIRQSLRIYGESGEVRLVAATSTEEALPMLDELADLHETSWKQRGLARGAFGSEAFIAFHKQVISNLMPKGGIQLLRVIAGDQTIGLVYNLVSQGVAYFYQAGLAFSRNNRVKPGFVCQILCVNHSRDTGLRRYDFMGGDTPYKRELGKYSNDLVTITLQRRSLRMRAIEAIRVWRRSLRERLRPSPPQAETANDG